MKLDYVELRELVKYAKGKDSIREAAKKAGVSPMTIQRALNDYPLSANNFVLLLFYIRSKTGLTFDSIIFEVMKKED